MKSLFVVFWLGSAHLWANPAFFNLPTNRFDAIGTGSGDSLELQFRLVSGGKAAGLNAPIAINQRDSLSLQILRLYLSNFVFRKNEAIAFEEPNSCHLLDLEEENTLKLTFPGLKAADFDQIQFKLGIDSLTNVSGALGGDLDPTKGMFWTWQSGYINAKMEGIFERCPTRNHEFQFHLGGYQAPFQSVQTIRLSTPKATKLTLQLDLTSFFENVDWTTKHNIMSPGKEAVELSKLLANCFSVHAD